MTVRSTRRLLLVGVGGLIALVIAGNLVILGASAWAKQTTPRLVVPQLTGVKNLEAVDAKLLRGAAPTEEGYRSLAANGVKVVVDLRAEPGVESDAELVRSLGMQPVRVPIRDGQIPSTEEVRQFLNVVQQAGGPVFVHCGAGVGRTGAMVGAYLVSTGQLNGAGALRRNLAVGTPSLEQVTFVAGMGTSDITKPPVAVTALSRVIDAPRRIYHNLGF
ncbi:MAG: dual specificity protein phosphatase family protein [Actinomycetota bacterium]|nr:dual specificity protein phosphatase family protein [Actinomycetota bacterium]